MNNQSTDKVYSNLGESKMGDAQESKKSKKWILAPALVVLVIAGYFIYHAVFVGKESTDDAQIDGHINPVAAKVPGHIVAILVKDNQLVQAGAIVAQIDPGDFQIAVDKARAELAAAKSMAAAAQTNVPLTSTRTSSQLDLSGAGIEQAEGAKTAAVKDVETARARLASTEARVREAEANYTKAQQDLDRMSMLIKKDEVSRQQYDAAVAYAESAKAARDSAKAGVEEIKKGIEAGQARVVQSDARIKEAKANLEASGTAPQQIAISKSNMETAFAEVKRAEATLAQAELNLEYTQIKAPIEGFVSQKKIELGQYIQGSQPLMAIVPLHDVWVTANFKENQLRDMQPGQKAIIKVDAYGGREYEGRVDSIAAATGARFSLLPPENATGNYVKVVQRIPVKIVIDKGVDEQHPLRPGLSVVATVYVGNK